ncbi:MAG: hypothetical protein QOD93_2691 [Acetobacteraceae bacterium]|jgi:hypothetical protein|nr:hypothetical protein [Acetobacteraceae bacterium]
MNTDKVLVDDLVNYIRINRCCFAFNTLVLFLEQCFIRGAPQSLSVFIRVHPWFHNLTAQRTSQT